MKMHLSKLFVIIASVSFMACNEEQASETHVNPLHVPRHPSVRMSKYQTTNYMLNGQKQNHFYVKTKDQFGSMITMDNNWDLTVTVVCPDCIIDTAIAVRSYGYNGDGGYSFSFPTNELKNYQVRVTFSVDPSNTRYTANFPDGIDSAHLSTIAMTLENHDVCAEAPKSTLHGLRGTGVIEGVERLAICDANDLALVARDDFFFDKDLYLVQNIDMASYYSSGGLEFAIGDSCTGAGCIPFSGTFNGNYKTILNFQRSSGLGLFGIISNGVIQDLSIVNSVQSDFSAGSSGGIVGKALISGAMIQNVSVITSNATGTDKVGGLVGYMIDSTISRSKASGVVTSNNIAGGLVGKASTLIVDGQSVVKSSSSSNTVQVTGIAMGNTSAYAGGLVGLSDSELSIQDSYSSASVSSEYGSGGLVGKLYGQIFRSFAVGTVSGDEEAGGLIGSSDVAFHSFIYASFSNATVNSPILSGGIGADCGNITVDQVFYRDPQPICGLTTLFTQASVTHSSPATEAQLVIAVNSIMNQFSSMTWLKMANRLPEIK